MTELKNVAEKRQKKKKKDLAFKEKSVLQFIFIFISSYLKLQKLEF